MTRRWSLSGRVTVRVALAVAVGWVIAFGLALAVINHEVNELLDATLESQSLLALEMVRTGPAETLPLNSAEAVRVIRDGVETRAADWPPLAADGHWEGGGWHVMRQSAPADGVILELGQSEAWRREEMMEIARAFLWLMLPFLALVLFILRGTIARGLAPAQDLARRVGDRDARDLSPISAADLPRELAPVPEAFNAYLARIETLLSAERAFAGHAAHELRTPIAAASAQAQLIAAGTAGPESAAQMARALSRLGDTVERLLQLSRAEAGIGDAASRADLVAVLRLLIRDLPRDRIRFDDGDLETAWVAIDPDALAILLGNLLRNAEAHGTGLVSVRLRPGPVLSITNPVAPGARLRPGRFDKSPDSAGAGLGLTIVETIARQNGIDLQMSVAEDRAEVALRFPPRPAGDS
ncbi:histidine kinase dimerization/phospho-acceptor domain-containing protein [Pseudodonghicola flavimaris]|uniref:histidine kinase n=1 Tax=Pseudodonghicola flavimaris TaxID=3050036 RepID=A0ABT7F159_9RHOB|nr:histidine kinase dimerization/phospho-acceptor domain-containing protein [Pseudodonghicola flavimaris]MDK3018209.1 histidine kinase dimerization/phospho-acceptor domain-containing protein [Pseudodonghicola flavimaris]